MDPSTVPGVLQKTVLPYIISYIPVIITLVIAWITVSQLYFKTKDDDSLAKNRNEARRRCSVESKPDKKTAQPSPVPVKPKKKHNPEKWSGRDAKQNFSHEWLLTNLKGHTGGILDMDFSANGKFLATCADDRAVFVWSTKDWKEKEHKYIRYNVEYDHASLISWSPDSKAFVYNRYHENVLEVCKVVKRPDGWIQLIAKSSTYPQGHKDELISLGIASNGKYIMTCSTGTDLILCDLKGVELARVDTYLMNNVAAKISPCGTFVAASGFAPDVKVWQVVFAKSGEFKSVSRAFELTGHASGVHDFAFNADSSLVATVSKDGFWRLFNIKIEYTQGEEPRLVKSGKYKADGKKARIALSPDGNVIALVTGSTLILINALSGEVDKEIPQIYSGPVTRVMFDAAGEYVLTAGDRHVRVFQNVTGHKTNIQVWKAKLNESGVSSATKERLTKTIAASEAFLKNFSN